MRHERTISPGNDNTAGVCSPGQRLIIRSFIHLRRAAAAQKGLVVQHVTLSKPPTPVRQCHLRRFHSGAVQECYYYGTRAASSAEGHVKCGDEVNRWPGDCQTDLCTQALLRASGTTVREVRHPQRAEGTQFIRTAHTTSGCGDDTDGDDCRNQ